MWGRGAVGCALWGVGSNVPDLIGRDFQGRCTSATMEGGVEQIRITSRQNASLIILACIYEINALLSVV